MKLLLTNGILLSNAREGTKIGGFFNGKKSKCSGRFGWKQNCGYP